MLIFQNMGAVLCSQTVYVQVPACDCCEARYMSTAGNVKNYCKLCKIHICDSCKESHVCLQQISGIKVKKSKPTLIKVEADKRIPTIVGAKFMPGGELVLCDEMNNRIKVLDNSLKVQLIVDLPETPKDFAVVDDKIIIVSFSKVLTFIQVLPNPVLGRSILLDTTCLSVSVAGGHIFVACRSDPRDLTVRNTLRLYDMNGELETQLPVKLNHDRIILDKSGKKIFDRNPRGFKCLSSDNELIYQYVYSGLEEIVGFTAMCLDDEDNIIACDSDKLYKVSYSGKKHRILKKIENDQEYFFIYPRAIAYRSTDKKILIGGGSEYLKVYKLK